MNSGLPENLDRFSLDTVSDYDPEELEATVAREKYDDYVSRFLPHLRDLRDSVTSETFATDLASASESAATGAWAGGKSLVNAQRGRMGLSALTETTSDNLRAQTASATAYNRGLRKGKDIQNDLLVGG